MHKPETAPVNHLSRQLALAIGWKEEDFIQPDNAKHDSVRIRREDGKICSFSVNDYAMMWKIAEKLDCFPCQKNEDGLWATWRIGTHWHFHKDPLKAVALAVIG